MKQIIYRQGDVILKKIDELPKNLKKVTNGLIIEGEASNHAHYGVNCDVLEAEDKTLYIDATNEEFEASLKHLLMDSGIWTNEHTDIKIEPGVYVVVPQRCYNPFEKAVARVRD